MLPMISMKQMSDARVVYAVKGRVDANIYKHVEFKMHELGLCETRGVMVHRCVGNLATQNFQLPLYTSSQKVWMVNM